MFADGDRNGHCRSALPLRESYSGEAILTAAAVTAAAPPLCKMSTTS